MSVVKEVEAEEVVIGSKFKFFVHRDFHNSQVWRVTEASTGFSIGSQYNKQSISKVVEIKKAQMVVREKGKELDKLVSKLLKHYGEVLNQ